MSAQSQNRPPVVIFQMGKVGSTSLYKSVQSVVDEVFQVHSLAPERIDKSVRKLHQSGLGIPAHLKQSQIVLNQYIQEGVPVKFITPIRSPIQRNISAFFQDLSTAVILKPDLRKRLHLPKAIAAFAHLPLPNEWKNALIQRWIQPSLDRHIDELISYFTSNFLHRFPLDWFDFELKEALGIDVYTLPFDSNKAYAQYQQGWIDLLVIKSEMKNDEKTKAIKDFLGIDLPMIQSRHRSADKSYGRTMRAFQSKLQLDKSLMNEFNQSRFVQHFYPEGVF